MAKKPKPLKLKKVRKQLLDRCNDLIKRFSEAARYLAIGHATDQIVRQGTAGINSRSKKTSSSSTTTQYQAEPTGRQDLLVLIHATLIQEWLIFLDCVFGEAVLHYLKEGLPSRLPSMSFKLNKVKPESLVQMRKSICNSAKDSFSFTSYPRKITTLLKLFDVEINENIQAEMKKHVTVRNIFQHNRGLVKESDLAEGQQYFELLNERGGKSKYYRDEKIILSFPEIENLNQIIKNYSEKFEELS